MPSFEDVMIDLDKVEEGKWFDWDYGIKLKIANVNKKAYKKHVESLMRPHLRDLRAKRLTGEKVVDICKPAVARHLLLDWNVVDGEGKRIPYSYEKAMEYLTHPKLPDLCPFILEAAGDTSEFRQELLEDAEKN